MPLKFKENAEPIYTTEPWYDIFEGGWVRPSELLEEADAEKVNEAIKLVEQFLDEGIDNDLIEIG